MYHQFMELRVVWCVVVALWLTRLSPVLASGFGKCPNYPSMPKFNMTKFLGKWYEVERSFYLPELASGCTTMTFENTTLRDEAGRSQLEISIKSLQSRLPTAIARLLPGSGRYQVLYTNYDNFAILWSCTSFVAVHADQIWLLGRDRDYSTDIRKKIYNALEQLSLDPDRLFIAKNKNCPSTL
uniref:Lipocln_cytosolic_FA-bd_dom domain-containing protein n=1 Tax=Anopheles quadriannulatus TaxID=34691 RepID=A0A182XEU3_ANOQN